MAVDTEHFKVSEFACKHCGQNHIDQRVINMAEEIRQKLGIPVRVNSGYRCEVHNKNVGGVCPKYDKNGKLICRGSNHMYGLAADLSCSLSSAQILAAVKELKTSGGLQDLDYCIQYGKKNFIHIDCGGKRNNLYEVRP